MTTPGRTEAQVGGVVLRLRPIVHASPVADGFHVRGAHSSFTVGGGPGLWRLWQALAAALTEGQPAGRLRQISGRPALQSAIDVLLARLAEHDMLVEVPPGWGQCGDPTDPPGRISRWLEAAAPDPVAAWHTLRGATLTVRGTGRVAAAAVRALRAAGLPADAGPPAATLTGEAAIVRAHGTAVAALAGRNVAVVTPVGSPETACADLAAVAARTGLDGAAATPHVLAALAGGAAAHRLVCAVAGLPDPGTAGSSFAPLPVPVPVPPGLPSVLVARLDPLRAQYHPWLAAPAERYPAEPPDMPAALAAAAALSDAELGVIPAAELADLPQLPAGLARCQGTDLTVYGVGVNAEMARLAAATGWCARALGARLPGQRPVAVGASRAQADGILLRQLVDRRLLTSGPAIGVDEAQWAGSAQARLWWKAVTLRFARPAQMRVVRMADGVFHATVSQGARRLGWAVESAPADAAAFAALTAAGAIQCQHEPGPPAATVPACGAQPAAAPDQDGAPPWQSGDWIWPADVAAREQHFHRAARDLLGGPPVHVLEPAVATDRLAADLVQALHAVGFVAVTAAA